MPVYEYERVDGSRFCELQTVDAEPFMTCPSTGIGCKRIVSRAAVKIVGLEASEAAQRDYRRWRERFETAKEEVHQAREAERLGNVIEHDAPDPGPVNLRDRVTVSEDGYAIVE